MKKTYIVMALLVLGMAGCGTKDRDAAATGVDAEQGKPHIAEGTLEPFCREWTNSSSAFERSLSECMFLLYTNDGWHVRAEDDGKMIPFWAGDPSYKDSSDAMDVFGLNISFGVQRALYDALTGETTVDKNASAEPPRALPDGYKIGKDGTGKYRWKDESGWLSTFGHDTRASAVRAACSFYDYEQRGKQSRAAGNQWVAESDNNEEKK